MSKIYQKKEYNPPALPFYVDAWLSNLKIRSYSHEKRSVYVELLFLSWKDDNTMLPDDAKVLAKLCETTEEIIEEIIGNHFLKYRCGSEKKIYNKKLKAIKTDMYKNHIKRVTAGRKGGQAKPKQCLSNAQAKPKPFSSSLSSFSNTKKISKDIQKVEQSSPSPSQIARKFFNTDEPKEKIIAELTTSGCPIDLARVEIVKFVDYWTEPNKSGSKVRWETEKTFEIGRRLKNWFRNYNKFNPTQNEYIA